ncbi:hypothetical protein [Devosia sp.]|uniref:hypothetical protein n=1 Tax=Devosia sp. TaxID=1871048 RepID=UPI003BABCD8D
MNRLLLAVAMAVMLPAGASTMLATPSFAAVVVTELGDMSNFQTIVADTIDIATTGDLTAAEKRITDFEAAWDAAAAALRPLSTDKWTFIDHAADAAIEALRSSPPDPATVTPALQALLAALESPGGTAAAMPADAALPFAITNADGSPVPCEVTLKELRTVLDATSPPAADKAKVDELQNKGIERCNADDDKRADGFFSQALAILGH